MSTLEDIKKTISPEIDMLHKRIDTALGSSNALMNQVVASYLKAKGKLIRPILVILTAKMLGNVNENVIKAAAAVELLHNASLIHDDVVDDSQKRRGQPTINNMWDNHIAVLVGDFFLSSALQQAVGTDDIRVVDSLSHLGRLLSLGEIDQLYNARNHGLSEEAYFEIIRRKTASLFVSCVEIGAYTAGGDDESLRYISEYADCLGLCFQIRDDIFDYFDDVKIGKPTGNDLREGKITLPLLYALNQTDNPQCAEMREMVKSDFLDSSEINTLIEYAKSAGGIDYAYQTMEQICQRAAKSLKYFPESPEKRAFMELLEYIVKRDF